jgi:homoserine kinase
MFTVTVPATTANLGPGFDCLGAALSLYNHFTFQSLDAAPETLRIHVKGSAATALTTAKDNLLYQSFSKLYHHIQCEIPAIAIEIDMGVPLARGLGSSATAIVGGLVGANQLAGQPLSTDEIMEMAIAIEGHPDNVVPALLGNCLLSVGEAGNWQICNIPWHESIIPVLAIPNFELSTAAARSVLPTTYPRADAIFNAAHLGLLLRALETGNRNWLKAALQDRIHQPYRWSLISGYDRVYEAALSAGAHGLVISGAGPTMLALASPDACDRVVDAIQTAWRQANIQAQVMPLAIDSQGAKVQSSVSQSMVL